jgi:hypothetical protein
VLDLMKAQFSGEPHDQKVYDATVAKGVADNMRRRSAAPRSMSRATNVALQGIPAQMVRFHTCYGINEEPPLCGGNSGESAGRE